MNIWYFCLNPNISLHNSQYAPSIHIRATIQAMRSLGHNVEPFVYGDEMGGAEARLRRSRRRNGRLASVARAARPLARDAYELVQNVTQDRTLIDRLFRANAVDLAYERLFPSKSSVTVCAGTHGVPVIVESNAPAVERHWNWRSPLMALIDAQERRILHRAEAVTVTSSPLKAHYEKLGIEGGKIFVLPNGVDESLFRPERTACEAQRALGLAGKTVVGFVGNIHAYHGIDVFLSAARQLASARTDIHFLIVSAGPRAAQVSGTLRQHGLADRCTVVGPIPNRDVPGVVEAMDICLLPDFMWYGSPMKLFEYAAMAKAIVAPDLPNIRDVFRQEENAILFEPLNVSQLTDTVLRLAANPDLRLRLGNRAREDVLASHTWSRNAERILSIYEGIRA